MLPCPESHTRGSTDQWPYLASLPDQMSATDTRMKTEVAGLHKVAWSRGVVRRLLTPLGPPLIVGI